MLILLLTPKHHSSLVSQLSHSQPTAGARDLLLHETCIERATMHKCRVLHTRNCRFYPMVHTLQYGTRVRAVQNCSKLLQMPSATVGLLVFPRPSEHENLLIVFPTRSFSLSPATKLIVHSKGNMFVPDCLATLSLAPPLHETLVLRELCNNPKVGAVFPKTLATTLTLIH
jgi:hypothetical protein